MDSWEWLFREEGETLAFFLSEEFGESMNTYEVFYENADTDEEKRFVAEIRARSASEALHKAAQFLEIPEHDLVVYLKQPPRPALEISPEESAGLGGFYSGIDN